MINIIANKFPQSLSLHASKANFSIFKLYPGWLPSLDNTHKESEEGRV